MDEESTPRSLSRRAFLRRIGRVRGPDEEDPASAAAGNEATASPAPSDAERALTPASARRRLTALGVAITPLSAGEERLQVQCKQVGPPFGREEMKLLAPLAAQIAWLNVATTSIDDEALETVRAMDTLCRLYLQHTAVEGPGLVHLTELGQLEYLNLYGTKVGDAALDHLVAMDALQTVYLWQTEVSEGGVETLRARRPDLSVEFGDPFFGT